MSLAAAGLAFAAACGAIEPDGAEDTPSVVWHSAAVSEANALIAEVRVSLSRPAGVFVEYDNPLAGRYRTALGTPAAEHAIPIVRLRPETTYDYTVFTVGGSNLADAVRGPGGSFTTGALPASFASVVTMATGRSTQPLILTDYSNYPFLEAWPTNGTSPRASFAFWDETGSLVWYLPLEDSSGPIARLPGTGNFAFIPWGIGRLRQFTALGEVTDLAGDIRDAHHDMAVLDEGRVFFPVRRKLLHDASASGGLRTEFMYDSLELWHSATGRIEQVWNAKKAWDILDLAQHWTPVDADGVTNWTHINSVDFGAHGNIVLSSRNRSQVVSLGPDYEIEWQLHGPDSDYEFPDPADRFHKQHTASQMANGNILLFDNGEGRPAAEGGEYSRALELRLDDAAGTAVKAWEYRPDPDIYARAASSAYRLANGNTLVNFGIRRLAGSPLVLVEADANGDEVFRAETVQLHPVRPGRYRAYGGIESLSGETMLRPPTAASFPFEKRLVMHYERMTPVVADHFDLYWGGGWLAYAKAPCEAEDVALPFFLHVRPKERTDLPADRRKLGFDNLDFEFEERGVRWQGRCHVELKLPDYEIEHIATGQFVAEDEAADNSNRLKEASASAVWSVEIPLTP